MSEVVGVKTANSVVSCYWLRKHLVSCWVEAKDMLTRLLARTEIDRRVVFRVEKLGFLPYWKPSIGDQRDLLVSGFTTVIDACLHLERWPFLE